MAARISSKSGLSDGPRDRVPSAFMRHYELKVRPELRKQGRTESSSMATQGKEPDKVTNEEEARAALVARLSQIQQNPALLKANRSLQPTPEAAKSRITRLRRKQRLLIKKSKRASGAQPTIPPPPGSLSS
jgi:hypothetical protein